jgi:hypothetical protein
VNSAARSDVSLLVERLLDVPPDQWQAELAAAGAAAHVREEVLAILHAVSIRLNGLLPATTPMVHALLNTSPPAGSRSAPPAIPGYEILEELSGIESRFTTFRRCRGVG